MSNSIIPNFLPPPYDFTTEESDTEEEEEQETGRSIYLTDLLEFAVFSLAFYIIMNSEINVSFNFSVSKDKNKSKDNLSKI